MSAPTSSALQPLANGRFRALCCECGAVRTCKMLRNRVYGDYETWTRDAGDLKCAWCRRVTRHAAVRGDDHDEVTQTVALGLDRDGWNGKTLQDRWRQGLPRNPLLSHRWWIADQEKAIEHNTRMRTFCGELIEPPPKVRTSNFIPDTTEARKPKVEDDFDTEYEDPATGLFWRDTDCVNCLRVSNTRRLERRRKHLKTLMTTALGELLDGAQTRHYDPHVDNLIELLESVHRTT
jgi:hypothetical protein